MISITPTADRSNRALEKRNGTQKHDSRLALIISYILTSLAGLLRFIVYIFISFSFGFEWKTQSIATISPYSSGVLRCYGTNVAAKAKTVSNKLSSQSQWTLGIKKSKNGATKFIWVAVFNSVNGEHHRWMPLKNSIMWLNWELQSKTGWTLFSWNL